ncbi:MAG: hypothetical protein IKD68_14305 [Solobacterium sp.]|nr:hypothetical protein [Solobacterium sp.]
MQCEAAPEQIGTGVIYELVILLPVFFLAIVLIPVVPESVPFTPIRGKVRMNH